jgi:hypothetical protein
LVESGRILYAGPVGEVVKHFESLGYELPDRTDVADWLLVSDDSALERWAAISNVVCSSGTPHQGRGKVPCKRKFATPYSEEFKVKYDASPRAQNIRAANEAPWPEKDKLTKEQQQNFGMKYRVSTWKSMRLVVGREMLHRGETGIR